MKLFYKKIILFSLIIAILILGLNLTYKTQLNNYGTMDTKKNDKVFIVDVPLNIQICNFGNSHGYYAFNYEEYEDFYSCFNFSLPAQSMTYNYRILESYSKNIMPGAIIYICLSYQTFFGKSETENSDFDSKNKRYYHFLKKEYIKNYDLKTDLYVNLMPAFTEANEINMIKIILNCDKSTKIDYWSDNTNQESSIIHGNQRGEGLATDLLDPDSNVIYNYSEIESLYNMIDLCNELGATPFFITTPFLSEYTDSVNKNADGLIQEFYKVISSIQEKTGVKYLDYSQDQRFNERYVYFFNTDHMNRNGAKEFTRILLSDTNISY